MRGLVSGADGFSGASAHIGNIDDLIDQVEAAEEADEQEDEELDPEVAEEAGDKGGKTPAAPKKQASKGGGWFDRDTKLANTSQKFNEIVEGVEKDLVEQQGQLQKCVDNVLSDGVFVKQWKTKGKTLLDTINRVLSTEDNADQELENFIDAFDESGVPDESASAGKRAAQGPPCQKFQTLVTVLSWRALLEELLECDTADELKMFCKDFPRPKAAMVDLINTCKKCTKSYLAALKQQETANRAKKHGTSSKQEAAAAESANQKLQNETVDVFDFFFEAPGPTHMYRHMSAR